MHLAIRISSYDALEKFGKSSRSEGCFPMFLGQLWGFSLALQTSHVHRNSIYVAEESIAKYTVQDFIQSLGQDG